MTIVTDMHQVKLDIEDQLDRHTDREVAELLVAVVLWVGAQLPEGDDPHAPAREPYGSLFDSAIKMARVVCPDLPVFQRPSHVVLSSDSSD